MTYEEIIQALRCISTPGDHTSNCEQCPYWKKEQLNGRLKEKLGTDTWTSCDVDKVGMDAKEMFKYLDGTRTIHFRRIDLRLWRGMGTVGFLYMRIGMLPMSPTGCRCRKHRRWIYEKSPSLPHGSAQAEQVYVCAGNTPQKQPARWGVSHKLRNL